MKRTKLKTGKEHLAALKSLSDSREKKGGGNSGEDPTLPLLSETDSDWLGNLRLLYGVPFNNLVPDERMLPRESIRFFFIDENWLDALCDGALSVGVQHSRDVEVQENARQDIIKKAKVSVHKVRRKITGAPPPREVEIEGTACGLLLRSQLVSGWPGMEIKAYKDKDGKKPIDKLRLNKLAPDVMLVLFAKVPKRVDISEPKEGLCFGTIDNRYILPKFLGKNADQPVGKYVTENPKTGDFITASIREGTDRVLDVLKTKGDIEDALKNKWHALRNSVLSRADFAIEMVKTAEQQKFINDGTKLKQED